MTVISATETAQPTILETIYKEDLVNPLTDLDFALEKGLVRDEMTYPDKDPDTLLDKFSQALFDSSRPIGKAIQGDTYLIDQLPESIGSNGQQIAALLFAQDFFTTNQAKLITGNEKQNQYVVDLIDRIISQMKETPITIFGDVKGILPIIQKTIDYAKEHGFLHLPDQEQVKTFIVQAKTPTKA